MATKSIVEKSAELKEYVTQFDVDSFCGFCAFFIRQHSQGALPGNMTEFRSVQKDLTYLIALNYFNVKERAEYFPTTDETVGNLANRVNDIKHSYIRDSFSELRLNVDRSYQHRALVHEQMFRFYHDNGLLNYMEQEINRIEETYGEHDATVRSETGLAISDFIDCFIALENIQRAKEHESLLVFREPLIVETPTFAREIVTPEDEMEFTEAVNRLPGGVKEAFLKFNECPHYYLKVTVEELAVFIEEEKAALFLEHLSTEPALHSDFSFYDQYNPLEDYPLLRIENGFLHTNGKQLLVAINELLFRTVAKSKTLTKACGLVEKELENQTRRVLEHFFQGTDFKVYQNYFIDQKEQDLLIECGSKVIVCECKSTQLRSPLRDIDRFYVRARDDFKKSIQKGYEQGERVVELLTRDEITIICDHKGKEIGRIKQRAAKDVSLWIVTDRSLGPAQVDLSYMLDSERPLSNFPWSVCIDDLETFLLYLDREPKPRSRLFDYVKLRPHLYGRVICPDELDLAGLYLTSRDEFVRKCRGDLDSPFIDLTLQRVFDDQYHSDAGLGFSSRLRDRLWSAGDLEAASSRN